jgi:hypothetical protein
MLAARRHGHDYLPGNFSDAGQGPRPSLSCKNGITQMTGDHWILGKLWARCGHGTTLKPRHELDELSDPEGKIVQ